MNVQKTMTTHRKALFVLLTAFAGSAFAHSGAKHKHQHNHDAHVHGVAQLDVLGQGNRVSVSLESPLFNLLGFERTPKTQAEKLLAKRAVSNLRSDNNVQFNPQAGCKMVDAVLNSAELNPSQGDEPSDDGHAEFWMRWEFECDNPKALEALEVKLFKQFPRFTELRAQLVLDGRQAGARLTPSNPIFKLR